MADHDDSAAINDTALSALLALEEPIHSVSCIARLLIIVGESGDDFDTEDLPAIGWLGDRLRECAGTMRRVFIEQDGISGNRK